MTNYMIVGGELYHHGIKGQRWGVRRYQNKDGTLTAAGRRRRLNNGDIVIKKGSTVGHVTTNNKIDLSDKATYAYTNENDAKIYRGTYAKYLNKTQKVDGSFGTENNQVYEYILKTKKDLRIPSEEKMFEQFKKSMNENAKENHDYMMTASRGLVDAGIIRDPVLMKDLFNPDSTDKHMRALYDVFTVHYLDVVFRYNNNKELGKSFVKGLESQNYNAILDYHNVGRYNDVKEPIIVLNGKKYLEQSSISEISVSEIEGNVDALIKKLGKVEY